MLRGIPKPRCTLEFECEVGALEGRRKGMAVTWGEELSLLS